MMCGGQLNDEIAISLAKVQKAYKEFTANKKN